MVAMNVSQENKKTSNDLDVKIRKLSEILQRYTLFL